MSRQQDEPLTASLTRIEAEPGSYQTMACGLHLRASLLDGDFGALGRIAFAEDDPRNRPEIYRRAIAALETRGPQAFTPQPERARWLRDLAAAGTGVGHDVGALEAISAGCETLARVHMAQWHIPFETIPPRERDAYREVMEVLREHGRGGSSLTSRAIAEEARRAYDLHQVIRRDLAFRRCPSGGWSHEFDPPLKTADLPLPRLRNA